MMNEQELRQALVALSFSYGVPLIYPDAYGLGGLEVGSPRTLCWEDEA